MLTRPELLKHVIEIHRLASNAGVAPSSNLERTVDHLRALLEEDAIQPPNGEPVFELRGQDLVTPWAILSWAEKAEGIGASQAKVFGARQHARKVIDWQRANGSKVPD